MSVMLGNLSVAEIEKRCGVEFSQEVRDKLNATHQDSASNIESGKWHCFDVPFTIVCGGKEFATEVYKLLQPYGKDMICSIGIGWN